MNPESWTLNPSQSEDMSRIRNKGAYLWGIVRNIKEGRNHKPQSQGRETFNNSSYPPRCTSFPFPKTPHHNPGRCR